MPNKKLITISLILSFTSFLILIILALFLPLFVFANSEQQKIKEIANLEELQIVNYNPIRPKLRQYIKLDDPAYWVIDQEYERSGLFSFREVRSETSPDNIQRVEGESIEEANPNYTGKKFSEIISDQNSTLNGKPPFAAINADYIDTDGKPIGFIPLPFQIRTFSRHGN